MTPAPAIESHRRATCYLWLALALPISTVACSDSRPDGATPATTATTSAAPCGPELADSRVRAFIASYNAGEADAAAFFAPEPLFEWYSDQPQRVTGGSSDPYDRSSLSGFLTLRHRQGDRIEVDGVTARRGDELLHVELRIERLAPDGSRRTVLGKAALHCQTQKFIVWSVGD
jgi:hypothetical protein